MVNSNAGQPSNSPTRTFGRLRPGVYVLRIQVFRGDQTKSDRLRYLMARLVSHLHDFARETRLSTDEWMAAIMFLMATGQICSDVRNVSQS